MGPGGPAFRPARPGCWSPRATNARGSGCSRRTGHRATGSRSAVDDEARHVRLRDPRGEPVAKRQVRRVVVQDPLGLLVQLFLLGLVGFLRRLGEESVELRVAPQAGVVAATAGEQAELVAGVRIVRAPAVAGDIELARRALVRKTLNSLPICSVSRPKAVRQASARNATVVSWPAPVLKPNFSLPRDSRVRDADLREGRGHVFLGRREVERIRVVVLVIARDARHDEAVGDLAQAGIRRPGARPPCRPPGSARSGTPCSSSGRP